MECLNGTTGPRGAKHEVTVDPDWTVTTPHDEEAERIAEAFGSYESCVTHIERTVKAFQASLSILVRSERVPLSIGRGSSWLLAKGYSIAGCCRGKQFRSAAIAARHTRSPGHLARKHRVPVNDIEMFLDAAAATWGRWESTPKVCQRTERLVREPGGVDELWQAGIHIDEIPNLAAVASVVDDPLPIRFYLGLVYGNTNRQWVTDTLAHQPDPDAAAWLAWLDEPQKLASPQQCGAWLQFGISRADVLKAISGGIAAEYVHEVAALTGWPINSVALQLVRWGNAGCKLTGEHFRALARHRIDAPTPSVRAIDELCEQVNHESRTLDDRPGRTELALMLEILGNRPEVLRALKHGVRTIDDLDTYTTSYEQTA